MPPTTLVVCLASGPDPLVVWRARLVAAEAFSTIGVELRWRGSRGCPYDAIRVTFSDRTLADRWPGAMAYALPYEGTHIVVFSDRIRQSVELDKVAYVMGHVLAHEIGHILEGVSRHSQTGLMKAHFTAEDYSRMIMRPIPFAREDVVLIRVGLDARRLRLVADRKNGS